MAGVKITDLGTLTTPVDADLLYIVDVSDTSQSPQGTSKQIEVGNLTGSLDIASGVFTPTASDLFQLDSVTPYEGTWLRVGESVTFGFYFEFVLTNGFTSGTFSIDIPQIINDFTTGKSNSYLCNVSEKLLGTEYSSASQNNGFQSISIGVNDYTDGQGGKVNFIAIYKR